jgi:hypothetical protein
MVLEVISKLAAIRLLFVIPILLSQEAQSLEKQFQCRLDAPCVSAAVLEEELRKAVAEAE